MQHDAEPVGALAARREREGRPRRLDRLLRPADALRHRRLGHEERARDLRGGQTADRAQGQRELRRAARARGGSRGRAASACRRPSGTIASAVGAESGRRCRPRVAGGRSSPRSWSISRRVATVDSQPRGLSGRPCGRPLHRRGEQRLLHRVLGGIEVAVPAHQRAEDLRRERAQQVLGGRRGRSLRCPAPRASAAAPRPGRSGRTAPGPRSRAPAPGCRRRRCRSCPGTPWPRGTGRR